MRPETAVRGRSASRGRALPGAVLALLAALLAVANLAFHAWTAGWLAPLSGSPAAADGGEPQRLAQQVRPEVLRLLTADEALAAMSSVPAPPAAGADDGDAATGGMAGCIEAGPFAAREAAAAERLLAAALGGSGWSRQPSGGGIRWEIVVGPYPDEAARQHAREALDRAGIASVALVGLPAAMPGFSLGRHAARAEAAAALAEAAQRGVQGARIVAVAPSTMLRIEHAEAATRARLAAIEAPVGGMALGRRFSACAAGGDASATAPASAPPSSR